MPFCEVRESKNIATCAHNRLCAALHDTIGLYSQQFADMPHCCIRICVFGKSDVYPMEPVAIGACGIESPLCPLRT